VANKRQDNGEHWARALWDIVGVHPEITDRGWLQTLAIFPQTFVRMLKMVGTMQLRRAFFTGESCNHHLLILS